MKLQPPFRPGPGTIWIGGSAPAPKSIREPVPPDPQAVLWLDATRDSVLAARIVPFAEAEGTLVDLLQQALHIRSIRTPALVRVASEKDASRVRSVLPQAAVEIGPTPEIARCALRMFVHPDLGGEDVPGYFHGGPFAPTETAPFFAFMTSLWKAAPWRCFSETQVLALDVPALGVSAACLAVFGRPGGRSGVGLFESYEDFEQHYSLCGRLPEDCDGSEGLGVGSLGLIYASEADLSEESRLEVVRQGWAVPRADAFPRLVSVGPSAELEPLTERDLRLACAAAAALSMLVRRYPRRPYIYKPDERVLSISLHVPWRAEATIRYPHPHSPVDALVSRHFTDTGRDRSRREADRWLEAFCEAMHARRHNHVWRGNAAYMISVFQAFRLDRLDGLLRGLRAWHVTEFLLNEVPRHVLADAEMVRQTPEIFDAYLEWLGEAGHEPAPLTSRIRSLVGRTRAAFMRKALDSASFSPAKSFLLSAQEDGVDLDDFAALVAYHERYGSEGRPKSRP